MSSSTFALCLASGEDTGGKLFLGGVPNQPNGLGYDVTYTPLLQSNNVFYIIPAPTDVLLNGSPVAGAASALAATSGSTWIVDSGV